MIVGLGNPGETYKNTRHNMGFMVIDQLVRSQNILKQQKKFSASLQFINIGQEQIVLVKPLTYMNLSGQPVRSLLQWFKMPLENLLIIYDDMDIEAFKIKIRPQGGSGGHKGLASIINSLNTQDFARIRIGIGRAPNEANNWVLGNISKNEAELLQKTIAEAAEAAECWARAGINMCMNTYN